MTQSVDGIMRRAKARDGGTNSEGDNDKFEIVSLHNKQFEEACIKLFKLIDPSLPESHTQFYFESNSFQEFQDLIWQLLELSEHK